MIGIGNRRAPLECQGGSRPPSATLVRAAPQRSAGRARWRIGRERSARIAIEGRGDRTTATAPTNQAAAVRISKNRAALRSASPRPPRPGRARRPPGPLHGGAQRAHRLAGVDDVLASSRPAIRVSPPPAHRKISARCEIDLSPGTRVRPERGRTAPGKRRTV